MTKEEWQELYNNLNQIYTEFLSEYSIYKSRANKKLRRDAKKQLENKIHQANNIIHSNHRCTTLLSEFLTGTNKPANFSYEKFLSISHFGPGMKELLDKIKQYHNNPPEEK